MSRGPRGTRGLRGVLLAIDVLSLLVPVVRRQGWRDHWHAELWHYAIW